MPYKIGTNERVIRYDSDHGIYILFENKIYQPAIRNYEDTLFGSKDSLKIVQTQFDQVGELILFSQNHGWNHYLEIYGYAKDNPMVWWTTVKETWYWVKRKPEGHYHYAC